MADLRELENKGDYAAVMEEARSRFAADKRALTDASLKAWCGRRFRNLFLSEAMKDENALAAADKKLIKILDKRSDRQKMAERFMRGDGPVEWKLEMPPAQTAVLGNTTLLFCPGMLNGLLPVRAFQEALPAVEEKYGWRVLRADLHPMRGCEENIDDLMRALEKGQGLAADCSVIEEGTPPGDVFLICYSKGMPDVITTLVKHPELAGRIRCIFNWAGATGGSYLADDIFATIKELPIEQAEERLNQVLKLISPVVTLEGGALRRISEFNIKDCIRDVTTEVRGDFLGANLAALDALDIPVFNITGSTTPMEVPYFQMQGVMDLNKYDANNDMQVTQDQAKLKTAMSADLAMLRGHHWDISYSPFPKNMRFGSPNLDHPFPREAALTAMVNLAFELGLID